MVGWNLGEGHWRRWLFVYFGTCGRLLFLLLVWNSSCLSLTLLHFPKVYPYCPTCKRVAFRRSTVLLVSCAKPSDEGIKATPSLSERTSTRRRRFGLTVKDATLQMNLSLPELIKITKKLKDMTAIALWEWNWRPLILQVLTKSVPISSLLRLISTRRIGLLISRGSWRSFCHVPLILPHSLARTYGDMKNILMKLICCETKRQKYKK